MPAQAAIGAKARERLRQNESMRPFFSRLATEEDSREFVHLLCYAVLLREQPGKLDPVMEGLARNTITGKDMRRLLV
jgi:hypothetical protein